MGKREKGQDALRFNARHKLDNAWELHRDLVLFSLPSSATFRVKVLGNRQSKVEEWLGKRFCRVNCLRIASSSLWHESKLMIIIFHAETFHEAV